jgi:predicted Kef-type K+ transport protein
MPEFTVPLLVTATFLLGLVARGAGLPPMVGFLGAGFVLHALGQRSHPMIEQGADLGVTLLMFTLGLKLRLETLTRPVVWAGASIHMAATAAIVAGALLLATTAGVSWLGGLTWQTALLVGFSLSFSSTVFAVKVLESKSEGASSHGRVAIGVLIMQDVLAVVFLAFSSGKVPSLYALLLLGLVPARRLLQRLLASAGHGELLLMAGLFLALVVGVSGFDAVGMKADLGALCVGVLLGAHPKAEELAKSLWSIKELLLIAFFLNIGLSNPVPLPALGAATALLLFVPLKVALYHWLFLRFRLKARSATLASLALANFSEFGLIVAAVGVENDWLDPFWLVVLALSVSLTFALASPLNAQAERLFERFAGALSRWEHPVRLPEDAPLGLEKVEFLVIGMGRVGLGAYQAVSHAFPGKVRGIDFDPSRVDELRESGVDAVAGDAHDVDFWQRVRPDDSLRAVLLATSSHATNLFIARHLRAQGFAGAIVAAAQYDEELGELTEAGVDAVHNVFEDAGWGLADHVFDRFHMTRSRVPLPPTRQRSPNTTGKARGEAPAPVLED